MNAPLFHSAPVSSHLHYQTLWFNSVTDFNLFVDRQTARLASPNRKTWEHQVLETGLELAKGTDWYGDPPPSSVTELDRHSQFSGMHLLATVQPRIQEYLKKFLAHLDEHVLPAPEIAYNDRGLGLFSFDRAAMGLFPVPRIDLNTPMKTLTSRLGIELQYRKMVTSTRKVYGWFEHKAANRQGMRLYLMAGAHAHITGSELLYAGLACAELVMFLERRLIPVEVNVLFGNVFGNHKNMAVVRVKKFDRQLDVNQLLLMSSDPRYFRFRGFKALIALADHFGQTIPGHLGRMEPAMAGHFVKTLDSSGQGVVFGQSYSLDAAVREVQRIVTDLSLTMKQRTKTP